MRFVHVFGTAALFAALAPAAWAAADDATAARRPARPPASATAANPDAARPVGDAVTHHEMLIAGQHIAYKATAGTLPLANEKGEATAQIFYTAYEADSPAGSRPVTFVFNGGPGAASAFLHIAAIGPRVIAFDDKGSAAAQPVRLIDNPDSWLAFTDLVFVDPVGTGFSHAATGTDETKFFGVEPDAEAMQEVVRLYLTRSGRILDPIFLAGESYGGFRAAQLAKRLLQAGYDLRGAVLISPALEFSLVRGDSVADLPTALVLPSLAFSHNEMTRTPVPEANLRHDVESFARGPYLTHLAAGLGDDSTVNAALAQFTGLPFPFIAHKHGRISARDFTESYRRDTDRELSSYDGSVSIALPSPADGNNADPILDYGIAPLGPAFVAYSRGELGYATDAPYRLLNRSVNGHWDFGSRHQGYAGVLDDLEDARTQRPSLRILIASGFTDLVTPYLMQQYLIDLMRPIAGAVPVVPKVYPGGHMMYLRAASRAALSADARSLYADAMK